MNTCKDIFNFLIEFIEDKSIKKPLIDEGQYDILYGHLVYVIDKLEKQDKELKKLLLRGIFKKDKAFTAREITEKLMPFSEMQWGIITLQRVTAVCKELVKNNDIQSAIWNDITYYAGWKVDIFEYYEKEIQNNDR